MDPYSKAEGRGTTGELQAPLAPAALGFWASDCCWGIPELPGRRSGSDATRGTCALHPSYLLRRQLSEQANFQCLWVGACFPSSPLQANSNLDRKFSCCHEDSMRFNYIQYCSEGISFQARHPKDSWSIPTSVPKKNQAGRDPSSSDLSFHQQARLRQGRPSQGCRGLGEVFITFDGVGFGIWVVLRLMRGRVIW